MKHAWFVISWLFLGHVLSACILFGAPVLGAIAQSLSIVLGWVVWISYYWLVLLGLAISLFGVWMAKPVSIGSAIVLWMHRGGVVLGVVNLFIWGLLWNRGYVGEMNPATVLRSTMIEFLGLHSFSMFAAYLLLLYRVWTKESELSQSSAIRPTGT